MLPMHLHLMRQLAFMYHPILARALTNGVQQLWSSSKKAQVLSRSHTQNEAQIDHPKGISWLLVAV